MVKVSWSDLTDEERQSVGNGCGPRRFFKIPFDGGRFTASCRQHDFYYARGYKWIDRLNADYGLYDAMCRDANRIKVPRRWWFKILATVYFVFVILFGWMFFTYGNRYSTKDEIMKGGH